MRPHLLVAAAVVLSAASFSARASSLSYVFTGTANGQSITLDFTAPSGPYTPSISGSQVSFTSEADNIDIEGTYVANTPDTYSGYVSGPDISVISADGVQYFFNGDLFSCAAAGCSLNTGTFSMNVADMNAEFHGTGIDFTSGSLAVAPTPEPSSIALLATGLLGGAGFIRRRVMA